MTQPLFEVVSVIRTGTTVWQEHASGTWEARGVILRADLAEEVDDAPQALYVVNLDREVRSLVDLDEDVGPLAVTAEPDAVEAPDRLLLVSDATAVLKIALVEDRPWDMRRFGRQPVTRGVPQIEMLHGAQWRAFSPDLIRITVRDTCRYCI
jgi:hypothetical protein